RHVIRLKIGAHRDLPIAVPVLDIGLADQLHLLKAVRGKLRHDAGEDLLQRAWLTAQADEHEPKKHLHTHRLQAELRAIQGRKGFACADGEQVTAELVGPAVIGAGQRSRAVATAVEKARTAVTTDIVKRAELSLRIPQRHDTVDPAKIHAHEIPGLLELA